MLRMLMFFSKAKADPSQGKPPATASVAKKPEEKTEEIKDKEADKTGETMFYTW